MRRTVVQILAPDNMRGRATGFLSVFAQTTNGLGAVIAGAGAALLGAPNAALLGCVLCGLTVLGNMLGNSPAVEIQTGLVLVQSSRFKVQSPSPTLNFEH